MKWAIASLICLLSGSAWAQGCGSSNPNCVVPMRPPGDNTNAAASTRWVNENAGSGGGLTPINPDNVLGNPTGGVAVPVGMAVPACSGTNQALTYNSTTHLFGCVTITPGGGGPAYSSQVNILDYGADPTGVADSRAAIQAAIDYAMTNHIQTVFCPDGKYKTTGPIFVDPPNGGLRGNPPPAAWSAATTYGVGDQVTFNGGPWKSLVAGNLNHQPLLGNPNWQASYKLNAI